MKAGDILLFHDSGSILMPEGGSRLCTVQALPYIIKDLKEKGYRFVTVSDMVIMSDLDGNIQ
jgi:peptidoglycan/xylan/chitin deacetylase (PgdA/CDA1 family)